MKLKRFKKIVSLYLLSLLLVLGTSITAFADTGTRFSATIKTGTAGYGIVNGGRNGKYYHLTPGRAGLEIKNVSGGKFEVYLYRNGIEIDRCVNITKPDWRRFYDIPKDASNYYLKIAVTGKSKTSYSISGVLHDHVYPK